MVFAHASRRCSDAAPIGAGVQGRRRSLQPLAHGRPGGPIRITSAGRRAVIRKCALATTAGTDYAPIHLAATPWAALWVRCQRTHEAVQRAEVRWERSGTTLKL